MTGARSQLDIEPNRCCFYYTAQSEYDYAIKSYNIIKLWWPPFDAPNTVSITKTLFISIITIDNWKEICCSVSLPTNINVYQWISPTRAPACDGMFWYKRKQGIAYPGGYAAYLITSPFSHLHGFLQRSQMLLPDIKLALGSCNPLFYCSVLKKLV